MFRTRLLAAILLLSAFLFSCSGEDGATGPAGKNGKDGNANVIVYTFGSSTTTSGSFAYQFSASAGLVDSSLVLGYFRPSGGYETHWYPVPGLGVGGFYMTRCYWYRTTTDPSEYTYYVNLLTPSGSADYTTSTTFAVFRIVLVPASEIIPLTSRGLLDLSDYNAVREYLNLPE